MQKFKLHFVLGFLFIFAWAGFAQKAGRTNTVQREQNRVVASQTKFGLELFRQLATGDDARNVFFSPVSVAWCLTMALNGAQGQTRQGMEQALAFNGLDTQDVNAFYATWRNSWVHPDPGVELEVANSLWARKGAGVRPEFLEINKRFFYAEVSELDFDNASSVGAINNWVNNKTRGKISRIIEQIERESVLFLLNAIYFKGRWTEEFDPAKTREEKFSTGAGVPKDVQMMRRRGSFRYSETPDFQAVSLPYGNGRLNMYIFLPSEESSVSLLLRKLTPTAWESWVREFQETDGLLALPRFRAEYDIGLNGALKTLGMTSAFDPQQADFGAMLHNSQNAFISKVKHKAFIEVNEEGTEAAAATSTEVQIISMPIPSKTFQMIVNRPFVVAIRDNESGAVLFLGSISDP